MFSPEWNNSCDQICVAHKVVHLGTKSMFFEWMWFISKHCLYQFDILSKNWKRLTIHKIATILAMVFNFSVANYVHVIFNFSMILYSYVYTHNIKFC